jgi:hypothetical protein
MNGYAVTVSGKQGQYMESGYAVESDARVMTIPNKKAKKPGFIKRWLYKISEEAWDYKKNQRQGIEADVNITRNRVVGLQLEQPTRIDQPERAIHFTVYNANGGRVIETRRHDRKTDRSTNGLYVITDDKDFGREIDKIIVMEGLR